MKKLLLFMFVVLAFSCSHKNNSGCESSATDEDDHETTLWLNIDPNTGNATVSPIPIGVPLN